MALMPGMALATKSDDHPLASLPSEYAPAVDAAAAELGVSSRELTSASSKELESLLCSKLDESSAEEFAAGAKAALADAPPEELQNLSASQRAQLEARLPSLINELEAKYCTEAARGNGARTDVAAGSGSDGSGSGSGDSGSGDSAATASGSGGSGSAASGSAGSGSGSVAAGATSDSGIPVPTRVDTGGGGAADGQLLPLAFGGLFAALFGLFGVGVIRRQQDA